MRFLFPELHEFEDVQKNFEQLEGIFNQPQGLALSFVQTKSAQNLQVFVGKATLTWPGASTNTAQLVVTHGLGRVPQSISLTALLNSAGNFWWPVGLNITATQMTIWGTTGVGGPQPVAGTTGEADWQVWG